ncbi:MAG: glycosyltransferase family 2 protein [Acidiferrobacterales bacterium]
MANIKFSIIIPTYNYAHFLPRVLDSILGQQGDDYDVTIIDDGSTDDSETVVQPFLQQHQGKLNYIYQENRGPSAARNRGVAETKGQYLIFVDADDRLLESALAVFRTYLAACPETDMVFGAYYSVYESGKKKLRESPILSSSNFINFRKYIRGKFVISNGSMVIRRSIFDQLQYPESARNNEHYVMDGQMLALFRCATVPEPVLEVYTHDSRLRQDIKSIEQAGLSVVDLLFNRALLPEEFMSLRKVFLSRLLLSRFRSYFQAGLYGQANDLYIQAIKARPMNIFRLSYLRKYLKSCWLYFSKGQQVKD